VTPFLARALAACPWITRLDETCQCDGYRLSRMPMRDRRNPQRREKWRCKAPARWKFRPMARRAMRMSELRARRGTYCWQHLWSLGIQGNMDEDDRWTKHCDELK
jgi:hypothetical protein